MAFPQVVAVAGASVAESAGFVVGDVIRSVNGVVPRDVIEYRLLVDEASVHFELTRANLDFEIVVQKNAGEPLGVEVSSPVFDRVRTCDNHCEFCFIYQLPKGMRRSLYVKDDDYRLSFLYGNFTTLTRFTELDLERVITERLSPLYVSIHATDPEIRSRMLRNKRGAVSLRWLGELLRNGIEVHGQIVVCPGLNDGDVLSDTLCGVLERFPELCSVAAVPLGVSRFSKESAMRSHTQSEAGAVIDTIESFQEIFLSTLGRRLAYAADEYYLLADRPFPPHEAYEEFTQIENGIGMYRDFEASFEKRARRDRSGHGGFFASIDGAPPNGYRATRLERGGNTPAQSSSGAHSDAITVLTSIYGERVLRPLLSRHRHHDVEILAITNDYFGGNIAVTGLLTGEDLSRALGDQPEDRRYLLPDVCLSEGRFLDGVHVEDLPRTVEVIETSGDALERALTQSTRRRIPLAIGSPR